MEFHRDFLLNTIALAFTLHKNLYFEKPGYGFLSKNKVS